MHQVRPSGQFFSPLQLILVGKDTIPGRSWPEMHKDRSVTKCRILSNGYLDGPVSPSREADGYATIPVYSSASPSSSSFSPSGVKCIDHRVTKMDTLAGIAIKYGVEVSDIRRMNGLVTDLQMFAHKSLQIPLPGRHPPSPIMSDHAAQNGEKTPPRRSHDDILGSLQSLKLKPPSHHVSPAMSSLQYFYGLTQPNKGVMPEGTEMVSYRGGRRTIMSEGHMLSESPPTSEPVRSRHRKSRSLVNFIALQNGGDMAEEHDGPVRRHQKAANAEPPLRSPEFLLTEEMNGGTFSGRAGKNLSLRSKPGENSSAVDPLPAEASVSVRKSSSTSNLSEPGRSGSSIWPTSRWSLRPEAVARPVFDGLPKPVAARRNKEALD